MNYCDLTLDSPAENLACDEVLLEECEAGVLGPVLRFWEPTQHFVVVGYANHVASEVNSDFCRRNHIPVLRRCTGGGTVLQGPGCLNYSLVLPLASTIQLTGIATTNNYVLQRHQSALQALLSAPVEKQGHTDLTIGGMKFSGNSQRRRKEYLLFHGTFLLHADISLIEKALPLPSYQPEYRGSRSHSDFLMNLGLPAESLKTALKKAWEATGQLTQPPLDRVSLLSEQKYGQEAWNYKF